MPGFCSQKACTSNKGGQRYSLGGTEMRMPFILRGSEQY